MAQDYDEFFHGNYQQTRPKLIPNFSLVVANLFFCASNYNPIGLALNSLQNRINKFISDTVAFSLLLFMS